MSPQSRHAWIKLISFLTYRSILVSRDLPELKARALMLIKKKGKKEKRAKKLRNDSPLLAHRLYIYPT